ncbi:BCL2/adenovirus E1B 19 kDa protein-interacting protein 2 [Bagarius yarrelli]|uniref:BCL2/adenovirus E1B 19 kDa protein-interacting protein 2 n=1 Tax=Bagarius yarrelli TaxID=175774 RepID=A0A556U460_BAGYA|nr:BCL2/adenovirus E1B 19 kDa protein-interacting protein 2 [Bagarius yarrelli]
MATDATESEGSLKQTDTNTTSSSEIDTPKVNATLENKSSQVAEQGSDDKAVPADSTPTVGMTPADNGDRGGLSDSSKTQEVHKEKLNTDEDSANSSGPVTLPHTPSALDHNGSLDRQESVSTTEARLRMEGMEFKEEWQDEDFPRPLPEEGEIQLDEHLFTHTAGEDDSGPQYESNNGKNTKRRLLAPDISLNLDRSDGSVLSDELDESTELDLDGMDTPSDNSNEFEWEDDLPKPKNSGLQKGVESVNEYSAYDERDEGRRWRIFRIGEQDHRVDMRAIEPYKRVISHGGYYGDGLNAIIVFAVCFMPESNQPNYRYIMDHLFKYVIGTLELLVAENYMIVYLNGATSRRKMPSVGWLRKCYQQIDRSSKFSQKIKFVYSLADLAELVPMEYVSIPECIKQLNSEQHNRNRPHSEMRENEGDSTLASYAYK